MKIEDIYEKKLEEMAKEIKELNGANDDLKVRVEAHERRIQILEGPGSRMMQSIRTIEEVKMDMFAVDENKEVYDHFKWVIPKEALFQATDDAIENGLLTAVEIGTMTNIRSLTSIRLFFNNGKKEW